MFYNLCMFQLFFMGGLMFILSLMLMLYKKVILIEWSAYYINSMDLNMIIYIDWMMSVFLSVIFIISSMVVLYSKEYMMNDINKKYFIIILILFIISMLFLIISPSVLSVILGWDGLGLISYCLIIYYQNSVSYNSGMLTLLMNRVGDVMLLIMIFYMMNLGSWSSLLYNFNSFMFMLMYLIMVMTKSAQIPFSMWLPAAMAAPTPVSSLVHSSTLVTAGVYLLIRYNYLFLLNKLNYMIMFLGLVTMLVSSFNSLIECDIKKVIAFSTLSQLGLMMMMISFTLKNYVFFHLISHAMFKCLLFMCSGVIIHLMNGNQDIRFMGSVMMEAPLVSVYFNFSILSLCGIPFLSGFYSKDLMYEMILGNDLNLWIYYMMYFCIGVTVGYSLRLVYYSILNMNSYVMVSMKIDSLLMSVSMLLLFVFSVIYGNLINWLLFSNLEMSVPSSKMKFILFKMFLLGGYLCKFIILNKTFMKYYLYFFSAKFLYLLSFNLMFNLKVLNLGKVFIKLNEILWNEMYMKLMIIFFMKKMSINFINLYKNIFMLVIMVFMYLFLLMYLLI